MSGARSQPTARVRAWIGPISGETATRVEREVSGVRPGALGGSLQPIISATDAAMSLAKGYVFVTNDGGHTAGFFDASWALIAPGVPNDAKLADYFYRATHQVTVATKALVKEY